MTERLARQDRIFTGIVVLVHLVFFLLALHYTRIYMGDSFEYIYEAWNIKKYLFFYSGNPAMPIIPEYMTQRQPLYPIFLLAVYSSGLNNWAVIVLQNVLSVFNICYLRKIASGAGYKKKYDWMLLLLVAAYPAQFINASTIAPDILLQTFTVLYFGSFIALWQKKQLTYAIWMSVYLVAGMLVKPVLYPFAAAHVIIVIRACYIHGMKMQRPVLISIVPLCALMLYSYWNFIRTEKFHFTSNQAFNASFYYYKYFANRYGADSAQKFLAAERREYGAIPDYKDRYDHAQQRGRELLMQNFVPYLTYHLANAGRIFVEPGKAEIDLFTGKLTYGRLYSKVKTGFYDTLRNKGISGIAEYLHENPSLIAIAIIFLFNCLRLIGLILFFAASGIPAGLRLFTFVLICYFAVAAGPIANTRYFLPVSLIAISCAVMGYIYKFDRSAAPA